MTRIDSPFGASDLERSGLPLVWRVARCQHGYTRNQTCMSCEGGYVDDTHAFANIGETARSVHGNALMAVTDDGESVCYVPKRFQAAYFEAAKAGRI